jgi:AcrR family transcriptional regulator
VSGRRAAAATAHAGRGSREAATRERLLAVAAGLFSEQGFRRVTVRDICREASANVAAVNYHFGDKQGLYREVVERALSAVKEFDAATRNVARGASPEEKLLHYAKSYLVLVENPEIARVAQQIRELFRRELSEPAGMRERLVEEVLAPRWRFLGEIVKGVLGAAAKPALVSECVLSIHAQCLMPLAAPVFALIRLETRADRERFAEHVVTFSLAGMRARAAELEKAGRLGTPRARSKRVVSSDGRLRTTR